MSRAAEGLRDRIASAAEPLLDLRSSPIQLRQACEELYAALVFAAGWDAVAPSAQKRLQLPDGTAIAPAEAARCILDSARTALFLRGVGAAIEAARRGAAGRRLEILYAGCGPLAPLALAIRHRLPAGSVRFWLVDVQAEAVQTAQCLVDRLDVGDCFAPLACLDATRQKWPLRFDIAIVETMQRALEKEPQVAITANVARQLSDDGILVPECVELDFTFYDAAREHTVVDGLLAERPRFERTPLLRLRAASAAQLLAEGASVEIEHQRAQALQAMIATRVRVYADLVLEEFSSAITLPLPAQSLGAIAAGNRVRARFGARPLPGVSFDRCPEAQSP